MIFFLRFLALSKPVNQKKKNHSTYCHKEKINMKMNVPKMKRQSRSQNRLISFLYQTSEKFKLSLRGRQRESCSLTYTVSLEKKILHKQMATLKPCTVIYLFISMLSSAK